MRRRRGYTLFELIVVVAIAGVLVGIGFPAMQWLVFHNRRVAVTNELVGAVQYARSEADTRSADVVLCPTLDERRCDTTGAAWDTAYLVFADYTPEQPRQVQQGDEPLLIRRARERIAVVPNRPAFVFRPHHRRASNGTFRICPPAELVAPVAVIVSYTGRPRVSATLPSGADIDCPDAT